MLSMERHEIRFNRAVLREQQRFGQASWRPPVHGTRVLVTADGKVCAKVRELGMRLPKKDRRYSAKIEGVEWLTNNTLSPVFRYLPVRGFLTPKEAMAAIDAARAIIFASNEEDALP